MATITVKPGKGRLVRLPGGRPVPDDGATVEDTPLIRRWLRNGDLVAAPVSAETKPAKAPAEGGSK